MLRKPIYCNCGCIYSNRQINYNNRFYIYCFRSLIYTFRIYIYSFRIFIYYDRYYNYNNRRKKKKRNRKVSTEIQLNGQKGDRLTAVWQYGGFRAFLESSVFIQSFVYICDGSVLKVRHIAKLQNVMPNAMTTVQND